MKLSISRINIKSPYQVRVEGDTSVCFMTDSGIEYSVGFAEDYSFMDSGAYQFYIANLAHTASPNDPKIRQTVIAILEEFFRNADPVMLYICDSLDNRQAVRNRLFRHWFDNYSKREDYHMQNESLAFDGIDYYASILLRRDNPRFDDITASFKHFIAELPDKINELQSNNC